MRNRHRYRAYRRQRLARGLTDFFSMKQYQVESSRVRIIALFNPDEDADAYGYDNYCKVGDIVPLDYFLPDYGKLLVQQTPHHRSFVLYLRDEGKIWEMIR